MDEKNEDEWREYEGPERLSPETPESGEGSQEDTPRDAEQRPSMELVPIAPESPDPDRAEMNTREALEELARRWERTFRPPDIVRQNRPSLLEVIAYAWSGGWGPVSGPWRIAGQVYAVAVAIPLVTVFYTLAWTVERPARFSVAVLLLVILQLTTGYPF